MPSENLKLCFQRFLIYPLFPVMHSLLVALHVPIFSYARAVLNLNKSDKNKLPIVHINYFNCAKNVNNKISPNLKANKSYFSGSHVSGLLMNWIMWEKRIKPKQTTKKIDFFVQNNWIKTIFSSSYASKYGISHIKIIFDLFKQKGGFTFKVHRLYQ